MQAAKDLQKEVRVLAEQMVSEPFCRQFSLDIQSFAKISHFLEQREDALETTDPGQEAMKESFRRFKAIWCLFLMQLEQISTVNDDLLNTLTLTDYLGTAEPAPEEITLTGHITLAPLVPTTPILQELHENPEPSQGISDDDAIDKTVMGNIINFVEEPEKNSLTLTGMELPMMPMIPLEAENSAGPWDTETMTPMSPAPTPALRAVPSAPTAVTEVEEAVEWSLPEEKKDTTSVRAPSPAPAPTVQAASEFYSVATYFKNQRITGADGISETHLLRLEALQICFAVELEFQQQLAGCASSAFWSRRKESMASVWDTDGKQFHPDLVAYWNGIVAGGDLWPKNERLPFLTMRNSLKIMAVSEEYSTAKLSPLETGLWIFLFGQQRSIGGVVLSNVLGLPPMEESSIDEAFLRLCRVHRLKGLLVNPSSLVTKAECTELRIAAERLFRFSDSWLTRSGSGS